MPASASYSSLTAFWALEEGSGQTVLDVSGHANHGTRGLTASAEDSDPAWISVPSADGVGRAALRFAGDDFVTVQDSATLETAQVSVSARVRATGSPGAYRYVASKGALRCETASYGLYTAAGGGLAFYVSNGAQYTLSPVAGTAVWDGRWHTILGTFDGSTVRLYIDGTQVADGTPSSTSLAYGFPDDDRFYIGDYRGPCGSPLGFIGDIDEVAVERRAVVPGDEAAMIVIDEDSISQGSPPNNFSASDVNDDIAQIGIRSPLRYFQANIGRTIVLHTGRVGDEGWFAPETIPNSWNSAGPTGLGLRNFLLAGPGLGSPNADGDREALLDKVPDVNPLRATGLRLLIGRTVCAVVYKSDISINYSPLDGSLKSDNRGIVAFTVDAVQRLTGASSSSLPKVTITIRDAKQACDNTVAPFTAAPAPTSSSTPFDTNP